MAEGDYFKQQVDRNGNVEHVEHGDAGMRTRSEATDVGARITMSGQPQQNEEGVHSVCVRLAEAISQRTGQLWLADPDRPAGPEQGVDRYLRSGGGGLWGVQVTRVGSGSRWARSARGEHVSEEVVASVAAAEIWEAIEKKLTFQGGILALSVGQPGMHAFARMVDEFRGRYGLEVRQRVRFSQVWLVGYSPETTIRIHP